MFQSIATRMLVFYFIMQGMNYFKGKPNPTNVSQPSDGSSAPVNSPGNMFPKGTRFDMYVFISEDSKFEDFDNEKALIWMIADLEYGNWNIGKNEDGILSIENQIELTPVL